MKVVGLEDKTDKEIRELLNAGGKVVYFPYILSFILYTANNSSKLFYIAPNESAFSSYGYKYFLISLLFGWWGIPFGPIYTIGAFFTILFGGTDITEEVLETINEKFQVELSIVTEEIEKEDIESLKVDIRGTIRGRAERYNAKFVINLFDITDNERESILSSSTDYQYPDSRVFFYLSEETEMQYQDAIFSDWVTIRHIPTLFIEFPRKGERELEVEIQVIDKDDYILEKTSETVTYTNENHGYLDKIDNQYKFEEAMIKTALLVSASDGEMDSSEAEVIKRWVKFRLEGYSEDSQKSNKERLNGYIEDSYNLIANKEITLEDTLKNIDDFAEDSEKYDIFELSLKVVGADNQAQADELKMLDDIAKYANLNQETVQKMREKELPISIYTQTSDNKESLVGILPSMSKSEIKKHLRKEYTKWNARVSNADPTIREQANKMIEIIVELRTKYK